METTAFGVRREKSCFFQGRCGDCLFAPSCGTGRIGVIRKMRRGSLTGPKTFRSATLSVSIFGKFAKARSLYTDTQNGVKRNISYNFHNH